VPPFQGSFTMLSWVPQGVVGLPSVTPLGPKTPLFQICRPGVLTRRIRPYRHNAASDTPHSALAGKALDRAGTQGRGEGRPISFPSTLRAPCLGVNQSPFPPIPCLGGSHAETRKEWEFLSRGASESAEVGTGSTRSDPATQEGRMDSVAPLGLGPRGGSVNPGSRPGLSSVAPPALGHGDPTTRRRPSVTAFLPPRGR
jgi:hypothetical protein